MTPPTVLPFSELLAPPEWRTVDFISDLHLQASEPVTFALWQLYMANTPADAVFLLGDVFEVWIGDDVTAGEGAAGFEARCARVMADAAQRHPLFFMHGNRDFLVGPGFMAQSAATLLSDPCVLTFSGRRWLLSHGDALCLDDVDYLNFRAEVRSAGWQQSFLAKPLAERQAIARGLRQQSEARKTAGAAYADVDADAARHWLTQAGASSLIHGHTHQPARHALGDGLTRVVLSDWDAGATPPRADVLRLTAQGLLRVALV